MFFRRLFGISEPRYIRRTRAYLEDARMAALEHSIAAEHYQSMAQMYAERAARLEEELRAWERGEQRAPEVAEAARHHGIHAHTSPKPVGMEVAPSTNAVGVVRAA